MSRRRWARGRTADKAAYSMGAGRVGWSSPLIKAYNWVLTLLSRSSLINKALSQEADPGPQDNCATGNSGYHVDLSLSFTPLLLQLPALSSWPEISKALSQCPRKSFGFFPLAPALIEPASYWDRLFLVPQHCCVFHP